MDSATQLKSTIRERWSRPSCVETWTGSGLNVDFHDPACRKAWLAALKGAVGQGRDALDLGTGPGTIAQLWAELGYRTMGVDFSPGMVETARVAAAAKKLSITFLEGDAEAPPIGRRRFDVISSRFVLFTLPHPGYAVRHWVKSLRPGGSIVLIGHDKSGGLQPRRRRRKPQGPPDLRHQEALRQLPFVNHTLGDLQVLLEAVGLRDIHRVPMDEIISTRLALAKQKPMAGMHLAPPFIIVGRK